MSKELDKLIEQVLVNSKNLRITLQEKTMPSAPVNTEPTEEVRVLKLPKFALSEKWGQPDSEDRKTISLFMDKIGGTTIGDKINNINSFVNDCKETCINNKSVPEILSNLIMLESLSSLITDYNPQTGGFLMESFLAGLLGGPKSRQVKGSGQIEDIYNYAGEPVSVKFLSPSSAITASGKYLLSALKTTKKAVNYLLIQKQKEDNQIIGLDFYTFTVGAKEINIDGDFDYADFPLSQSDIEKSGRKIGETLDVGSKDQLKQIADNYTKNLGDHIFNVFNNLDSLIQNVNKYMLDDNKGAGKVAAANAQKLKDSIDKEF
jgi:hypothetical protein